MQQSFANFVLLHFAKYSAATHLRRGGQCGKSFIAIFYRIQQLKNFENRPTFVKVMNKCIVAQFFSTRCVVSTIL